MNASDFHKLIQAGESDTLEFKLNVLNPENIAKAMCSFLNHLGGQVVIGIDRDNKYVGIKDAKNQLNNIKRRLGTMISPSALWSVEQVNIDGLEFFIIEVPEGLDKPYVTQGAIYIRRGAHTVAANRDEISSLILKRSEASQRWERQVVVGADIEDLDVPLISDTANMALASERWKGNPENPFEFLQAHGLVANNMITNAALVLFGRHPTRWLPQHRVRLAVLPENKISDHYILDKMFDKCLLRMADQIPDALSSQMGSTQSRFSDESWQREERISYPSKALREGVMNALIHRDYSMSGITTILVEPNCIKISNPGGLPDEIKIADLKREHSSIPRNPDIAHVFYLRQMIEMIGRGTQRIVSACRDARLRDPKWESSRLETKLTLFGVAKGRPSENKETLSDRQQVILSTLRDRKLLKAQHVVKLFNGEVTDRSIRNDLQSLVDSGWLVRRGRGRSVSYVLGGKELP